ncbi:MAG: D-alanyl-D-alanine carboxypeptidase family protein [Raoultibacter sp.]|jgi:D-alanyl-D-alanine carboxypeptidase (penicillin-binding protein 5/6)
MKLDNSDLSLLNRFFRCGLALLLACSFYLSFTTQDAYADVRKADIVLGETVDSRGLSLAQCASIDAEFAIVMNSDNTVFFERNSYSPAQIASITKIMTALVALENADEGTFITVSANAASVGESSASLQEGDILTFDAAMKGLMLSSGNDAALAIAESIGEVLSGGTAKGEEAQRYFVDRMNSLAQELGVTDTVFTNPHGLDDGQYASDQHSCAYDVALIAQKAMENEQFRSIVATPEDTISVKHADGSQSSITLTSTDALLSYYEGACGIKTGFTNAAGYCFAGAANRGEGDVYAIVLKSTDENMRFEDTSVLFDWYFEHMVSYPLAHSPQSTSMSLDGQSREVPLIAEVTHTDWIDKTVKATLANPDQSVDIFDLNGNINQSVEYNTITGDVEAGDKVGSITFKQRNDELITVDLLACEDVKAPDLFEGIGIWWDRLFRGFSNQPTEAESVLINETPLISTKVGAE